MLIAAVVVSLVAMTAVFTVTGRSTQAWFGSGSCPMPGGFVPGHKCLAVDANGVEVPYKGEIILPHGTTTITDHILTNASHPVTGNYQLQIVEDNGTCCAVFQTFDYTVDSSGATSPSTFVLNQATLTEAFTHHPVGNGGMVGYFLFISNPSAMGANDTCANTVTFDDGAGAPLTATSGSGKCNPPQPVPNTGELVSHIFDCAAGNLATDVVPPGTVAVTSGPLTKAAAPSPVDYITVPTGTYGLIAAAPSGYHLMGDGCLAGSKSTGSATVPVQGKGEVDFFVSRDSGSLVGHIYDCTSGTADTTHDIGGNGAIAVSGPVNKNAAPNPISYSVPTGDYTETATPPTSYHVVSAACQAPGSSTASVTVKPDKPGEAIFYVARDTGDLAGNIYDCTGGTADTSKNIAGGKLSATGPSNVAQQANPLNPTVVPSGTYKMSAVAPAGYHLVSATCQVATGADNAEVVVPANGHGVGNFFVSHDTGMLAGHIYDCSTNSQSTSEVSGGTLGASGAGTVAAAANPMPATVVPTGGYTVTGTAPGGYHFVACQESAGGASTGATVVTNQTAVAILYVAKNPPGNGGTGGGGTGGNGGTGGSGGTGGTGGAASNSPAGGVAAATGMVKGAAILVNPRTGHSDLARLSLVSLVLILMGGGILLGTRRNTKLSS